MTGQAGPALPTTAAGRAALDALLRDPARSLLCFDFDGTLAPIVEDPASARAHPEAVSVLSRLAPHVGLLAIVTGRPAAVAVANGGFADVPGLERLVVLGQYGRERWDAASGEVSAPPAHPGVAELRAALPALLADLDAGGRLLHLQVEDKGAAIAVHTRRCPDPAAALAVLLEPLTGLAERSGLSVEPGRNVLELRPPGFDKGGAVRRLVEERHQVEEGSPSCVSFAGDDLGDLAAYDAVVELRAAGTPGLLIASASAEVSELSDRADVVLDGPAGVVAWLADLTGALELRG